MCLVCEDVLALDNHLAGLIFLDNSDFAGEPLYHDELAWAAPTASLYLFGWIRHLYFTSLN